MNLTEATIMALQGKMPVEAKKSTKKQRIQEAKKSKNESVNVSLQDDGSTVVDTDDATVIVQERQPAEEIIGTTPVPVDEPIETEECPECVETPQDEEAIEDLDESKIMNESIPTVEGTPAFIDFIFANYDNDSKSVNEVITEIKEDISQFEQNDWEGITVGDYNNNYSANATGDLDESKLNEDKELKYDAESFSKVIESYLKSKTESIQSFKATKVCIKEGAIKIKGIITENTRRKRLVCYEMKSKAKGKTYERFALVKTNGILVESIIKPISMTVVRKNNILECRNMSKNMLKNESKLQEAKETDAYAEIKKVTLGEGIKLVKQYYPEVTKEEAIAVVNTWNNENDSINYWEEPSYYSIEEWLDESKCNGWELKDMIVESKTIKNNK